MFKAKQVDTPNEVSGTVHMLKVKHVFKCFTRELSFFKQCSWRIWKREMLVLRGTDGFAHVGLARLKSGQVEDLPRYLVFYNLYNFSNGNLKS